MVQDDGRKGLGRLAAVQFLTLNGYPVTVEDDEAYDAVVAVVAVAEGPPDCPTSSSA